MAFRVEKGARDCYSGACSTIPTEIVDDPAILKYAPLPEMIKVRHPTSEFDRTLDTLEWRGSPGNCLQVPTARLTPSRVRGPIRSDVVDLESALFRDPFNPKDPSVGEKPQCSGLRELAPKDTFYAGLKPRRAHNIVDTSDQFDTDFRGSRFRRWASTIVEGEHKTMSPIMQEQHMRDFACG